MKYTKFEKIVVVGASAGGINAVRRLLSPLPKNFAAPIVIAQHMNSFMNMFFLDYLNSHTQLKVKEAQHMELLLPGRVYYIPPNYHALYENTRIILNADAKVNYSRPSIDVLFESVAFEEKEKVIGLILTGANNDGSYGMKLIQENGGACLVQDPETADSPEMPRAALKCMDQTEGLSIEDISKELIRIVM
jgi:two-component system chemotaxis response regulator CheB